MIAVTLVNIRLSTEWAQGKLPYLSPLSWWPYLYMHATYVHIIKYISA